MLQIEVRRLVFNGVLTDGIVAAIFKPGVVQYYSGSLGQIGGLTSAVVAEVRPGAGVLGLGQGRHTCCCLCCSCPLLLLASSRLGLMPTPAHCIACPFLVVADNGRCIWVAPAVWHYLHQRQVHGGRLPQASCVG